MFIEDYLTPFLEFVEEKTEGVCLRYKQSSGKEVNADVKNDPFAVFDLYRSQVADGASEDDEMNELQKLRDKIRDLEHRLEVRESEVECIHRATMLMTDDARKAEEDRKEMEDELKEAKEQLRFSNNSLQS